MSDSRDDPEIYWVEPRLRAILPLDGFHCSRSLARTLRRGRFAVTCNTAFDAVIDSCAAPRAGADDSWISQRIRDSYRALHALGHAHSIETWACDESGERQLVGGLYGVGFGRVFCGESMFSRQSDASKVALAWLVAAMRRGNAALLDCQFPQATSPRWVLWRFRRSNILRFWKKPCAIRWCRRRRLPRPAPRRPGRRHRRPQQARSPCSTCPQASPRSWPMRPMPAILPRRGTSSRSP